jgi:glycosyltransferase involved in cell wall biosynthesis
MQIFVLGSHRSGTSALTRLLNMMGAYFGPEGLSVRPNRENPKGFWERRDIRDLDNALLASVGADWHRIARFDPEGIPEAAQRSFAGNLRPLLVDLDAHRPWVAKDPRFCLVFPEWKRLLEVPVCVVIYRNPLQAARSLQVRNGFPLHFGLALWEKYTCLALNASQDVPRTLVSHTQLFSDPMATLRRLHSELEALGVAGLRMPSEREVTAFIEPSLVHHHENDEALDQHATSPQLALYKALERGQAFDVHPWKPSKGAIEVLAHYEDVLDLRTRVDDLTAEAAVSTARLSELPRLEQRLTASEEELGRLRPQAAALEQQERTVALQAAEIEGLTREVEALRRSRQDAGREAERLRLQAHAGQLEAANDKLKGALKKVSTLESSLRKLRQKHERLERQHRMVVDSKAWKAALLLRRVKKLPESAVTAAAEVAQQRAGRIRARFGFGPQASVAEGRPRSLGSSDDADPPPPVPPRKKASPAPTVLLGPPTEEGPFFSAFRQLVEGSVPSTFAEAWSASEGALHETGSWRPLPDPAPLVSVIMPSYNRADIIGDAIATVVHQTYAHWELLVCDDASEDDTENIVRSIGDPRISYRKLPKGGAARARNAGLAQAAGDVIAYLDSDNLWHPRFLEVMTRALVALPGRYSAYCKYVDVIHAEDGPRLKKFDPLPFDYQKLSQRNFIDLNGFVHRRELYEHLGGFNEELLRQQDWDLVLKYSYLRDPVYVDRFLMLYQRNDEWKQITKTFATDTTSPEIVRSSLAAYYRRGLPSVYPGELPSLSILSWDICRNHFSKAYNLAEAMADRTQVELAGFRFFDEPIFPPYAEATPAFRTTFRAGRSFPAWTGELSQTVATLRGDVLYAVKPRLPSLGVALLANYHFGKPIVLEANDLESVVTSPKAGQQAEAVRLAEVNPADPELLNPYGSLWTAIMEGLAGEIPLRVTHNGNLDEHFGGGAFFIRNPKDETHFDPDRHDRDAVRKRLGFGPSDRVILFGGMVRRHKGVFELLELLERAGPSYRLLIVGSRSTPDQAALAKHAGDRIRIIEPVDRNGMAAINLASDAVVLWLNPDVPASYYQMPYKLTDALAMKVPVLANDIGDLGDLGRQGYLRLVPFGDVDGLAAALDGLFDDRAVTAEMVEAGRKLYLRQFSYGAVRRNLEMILRIAAKSQGTLPVAKDFAEFFSSFYASLPLHEARHETLRPAKLSA